MIETSIGSFRSYRELSKALGRSVGYVQTTLKNHPEYDLEYIIRKCKNDTGTDTRWSRETIKYDGKHFFSIDAFAAYLKTDPAVIREYTDAGLSIEQIVDRIRDGEEQEETVRRSVIK